MKSVGEVMAIGRSFPEALQKAVQMLNIGASCLLDYPQQIPNLANELEFATDRRILHSTNGLQKVIALLKPSNYRILTHGFLIKFSKLQILVMTLPNKKLVATNLLEAKQLGLSDKVIASIHNLDEFAIRVLRHKYNIKPVVKQIDTVAGEFQAQSNYLYLTYHGTHHDLTPSSEHICILGSGCMLLAHRLNLIGARLT